MVSSVRWNDAASGRACAVLDIGFSGTFQGDAKGTPALSPWFRDIGAAGKKVVENTPKVRAAGRHRAGDAPASGSGPRAPAPGWPERAPGGRESRRWCASGRPPAPTRGCQPSRARARSITGRRRRGSSSAAAGSAMLEVAAGELEHPAGHVEHRQLLGIAEIDRARSPRRRWPSSAISARDHVVDIAEGAGLPAVAVDRQRLAAQRLGDEVGDDPAVLLVHPRPVGVEDPGDLDRARRGCGGSRRTGSRRRACPRRSRRADRPG